MSTAKPLGPSSRIDRYALRKGWTGDIADRRPLMTSREYHRFWRKFQRWVRLPADRKKEDDA